jgi:iron(III) transport system substrate-binding protein
MTVLDHALRAAALGAILTAGAVAVSADVTAAGDVVAPAPPPTRTLRVLTYKEPERIDVVLRVFEGMADVGIDLVYRKPLAAGEPIRLTANPPFDVVISSDTTLLDKARLAGATVAMPEALLRSARPQLLGPDAHWISTSMHARAVVVARDRVSEPPRTYEELAHPKWRGKLCLRSGLHPSNLALTAAMIAHTGAMATEDWLRGLKANLARKPTGDDRDQLRAVVAGVCDVAIADTSYLTAPHTAQSVAEEEVWARKLAVVLPRVPAREATHVGSTGVAILAASRQRELAQHLVAFLVAAETQALMSTVYGEYPVLPDDTLPALHRFGRLEPDPMSISRLTEFTDVAQGLVVEVGVDDGPPSF